MKGEEPHRSLSCEPYPAACSPAPTSLYFSSISSIHATHTFGMYGSRYHVGAGTEPGGNRDRRRSALRGKESGVTSNAISGPYCTAIGAMALKDTTETTRGSKHLCNTTKYGRSF